MKNKTYVISFLAIFALGFHITTFNQSSAQKYKTDELEMNNIVYSADSHYSKDGYANLDSLKNASEIVVYGEIINIENVVLFDHDKNGKEIEGTGRPFQKQTFKVNDVYQGAEIVVGEEITVLESGGAVTMKQFGFDIKKKNTPKVNPNKPLKVLAEGLENSKKGEKLILFLIPETYDSPKASYDYYLSPVSNHGRFYEKKLNDDIYFERKISPFDLDAVNERNSRNRNSSGPVTSEADIQEVVNTEVTSLFNSET